MSGLYQAIKLGRDMRPSNGAIIATAERQQDLLHLWEPGRVVIAWSANEGPPRRLSQQSLASVRRKRLRRRLERKHPLFAEELFQREIAQRPDHFAGIRRADQETDQ